MTLIIMTQDHLHILLGVAGLTGTILGYAARYAQKG